MITKVLTLSLNFNIAIREYANTLKCTACCYVLCRLSASNYAFIDIISKRQKARI